MRPTGGRTSSFIANAPMTIASPVAIRTAPAATSFACPSMGWNDGDATSVRNSKAVLSASAVQTDTMARTNQHHSDHDSSTNNPAPTTTRVGTCRKATPPVHLSGYRRRTGDYLPTLDPPTMVRRWRVPAARRQVVEPNQKRRVATAVSCDTQQVIDALEPGFTREIVVDIAYGDRRNRVHDDVAVVHPVTTANFHMRTRPDANGASDPPAPDSLPKVFEEHHKSSANARPKPATRAFHTTSSRNAAPAPPAHLPQPCECAPARPRIPDR